MIQNFIYQIGLEGLKQINGRYNFRCYVCKDSQTRKKMKRGWIFKFEGEYWYNCYNCGYARPLKTFLKDHCNHLYLEYVKSLMTHDKPVEKHDNEVIKPRYELEQLDIPTIASLDNSHFARQYLVNRQISMKHFDHIYFTYNYQMWINTKIPDKFIQVPAQDHRIVLPIYNINKKIIGVQGRAVDKKSKLRYITIMFNENDLNVSGLERVDKTKQIYVTEGYFDSLFLPNAISMNSANVNFDRLFEIAQKEQFIFVYDNERRNKEIKARMLKVAKAGFKICLWPKEVYEWGKDINKMIENKYTIQQVCDIIDSNVLSGICAVTKINMM